MLTFKKESHSISEEIKIPAPVTKKIDNNLPAGEQENSSGQRYGNNVNKVSGCWSSDGKIVEKVLLSRGRAFSHSNYNLFSGQELLISKWWYCELSMYW